jgi:hypothetical protein
MCVMFIMIHMCIQYVCNNMQGNPTNDTCCAVVCACVRSVSPAQRSADVCFVTVFLWVGTCRSNKWLYLSSHVLQIILIESRAANRTYRVTCCKSYLSSHVLQIVLIESRAANRTGALQIPLRLLKILC